MPSPTLQAPTPGPVKPRSVMQHAFTSGEISPMLLARQDFSPYASACAELENFIVTPQGSIINDNGTRYYGQSKNGAQIRLQKFVYNTNEAYCLEFGAGYIRFYNSGGQVQLSGSSLEVVTPYQVGDLNSLKFVQNADYLYITHQKYPPATLARVSDSGTSSSWTYAVFSTVDGPYMDENTDLTKTMTASATTGTAINIAANFGTAFQSGDVGKIMRLEESISASYDTWTSTICYENNGLVVNAGGVYRCINGSTYAPSDGSLTRQHNTATWQNGVAYPVGYWCVWGQRVYISTDRGTSGTVAPVHTSGTVSDGGVPWLYVGLQAGTRPPVHTTGSASDGNLWWLFLHGQFGVAQIDAVNSGSSCTAHFVQTDYSIQLPDSTTEGTVRWRIGAWGSSTGYPTCAAFYLNRLYMAGTPSQPQTLWGSNSNDFDNFAPTDIGLNVLDTNSINETLNEVQSNAIEWMVPQTRMLIGTSGGVFQLKSGTNTTKALAPSNIDISPSASEIGCNSIPAKLIMFSFLATSRSGNKLYEYNYQYLIDNFEPTELTLFPEHIFREHGGALLMDYQNEPYPTLWFVCVDGTLVGFAYEKSQKVNGFHRHTFVGGKCESVAVLPDQFSSGNDAVWVSVNRTLNGTATRCIEVYQDVFHPTETSNDSNQWFVQCGVAGAQGTASNHWTGANYLVGETMTAIVDGAVQPSLTVASDGSFTTQDSGTACVVGIPYVSNLRLLPVDIEAQTGNTQAKKKTVATLFLRVVDTIGFSYGVGQTGTAVTLYAQQTNTDVIGAAPTYFTGDVRCKVLQNIGTYADIVVQQTQPYPLQILGVVRDISILENV